MGLAATLLLTATVLASPLTRLPSNQVNSRGIYSMYDDVTDDIDRAHGFPVSGGHHRWSWKELEPTRGSYRFDKVQAFVALQAGRGKKAGIGLETFVGRINQSPPYGSLAVPDWLWQTYPDVAPYNTRGGGEGWYTLDYLNLEYQARYREFINAFADWLAANPSVAANVAWLEMGVGMYSETQPSDFWKTANYPDYVFYLQNLGYTADSWKNYVNWCTDTYYNAFRVRQPSLSSIVLFLNCAPDFPSDSLGSGAGRRNEFTDYAAMKGVGLKNNGLQVDRHPYYLYEPLIKWCTTATTVTVPIAWETYEQWLTNETEFYWGMLCALDKHPDVMLPERWLLVDHNNQKRTNYIAIWNWLEPYLGVSPSNTPSVWCALRDTEFGNGEPGNFEFFLYQRDAFGPNGGTVKEFNVTSTKEGRYTRRTDQGAGNRYMWFRIDDQYVNGNSGRVPFAVSITYLDRGTDSWQLWYDSFSGEKSAGIVQKANSNTWKKATFTLTDARFGNGIGTQADLKLDCNNDGDDYFHMVEIQRASSSPTPTPTNTPVAATIQGSVNLQGRPTPPHARWSVPLTVTVCGTPYLVTSDTSGNFAVAGLTAGNCDIAIRNTHTLSNIRRNYTLVNGVNTINMGELKEGDANGDDRVNSSDFLLLRGSYFKSVGQAGFVDGADFNEDDVVNSSDFLLLRSNYFQNGPVELSEAQARLGTVPFRGLETGPFKRAEAILLWAQTSGTVSIAIEPPSTTVDGGDYFDLDVRISAETEEVAAADVYLDFDPRVLEMVEIRDGQTLPVLAKLYDNHTGIIDIGAGTLGTPVTGSFVLATLRFRARSSTQGGTTSVSFSLTAPRQTVVKDTGDHNLLGSVSDGQVGITATTPVSSICLPIVVRH